MRIGEFESLKKLNHFITRAEQLKRNQARRKAGSIAAENSLSVSFQISLHTPQPGFVAPQTNFTAPRAYRSTIPNRLTGPKFKTKAAVNSCHAPDPSGRRGWSLFLAHICIPVPTRGRRPSKQNEPVMLNAASTLGLILMVWAVAVLLVPTRHG
jgi:hypothetical protein